LYADKFKRQGVNQKQMSATHVLTLLCTVFLLFVMNPVDSNPEDMLSLARKMRRSSTNDPKKMMNVMEKYREAIDELGPWSRCEALMESTALMKQLILHQVCCCSPYSILQYSQCRT